VRKGLAKLHEDSDLNGNDYSVYSLTETGMSWLLNNQDTLALRKPSKSRPSVRPIADDEEVPF
jgi:hypothetical protein